MRSLNPDSYFKSSWETADLLERESEVAGGEAATRLHSLTARQQSLKLHAVIFK